jgi:hypothetical protein
MIAMHDHRQIARYNQRIRNMQGHLSGGQRLSWLLPLFLLTFLSAHLSASIFADAARQLAHQIATATGPGIVALEITNRSSLDEKSIHEARSALEAQLRLEGVRSAKADQAMGTVQVTFSESVREYVWAAEIVVGSDEKRVALVSLPRAQPGGSTPAVMPVILRKTFLFAQQEPILDAALIEMSGGPRLLVLDDAKVAAYHQQSGHWEQEASMPIAHSRSFPRDVRGRLLLRRDHLFDAYLPGTFCRSSATAPITLACSDSDDPWPLTADDAAARAFFAPARNFFTGALSPGIGKVSNVPSFYSAAALPRSNYTLWVLAAVDGSVHVVDGMADQVLRGVSWGSDLAAIRSTCGTGSQILVSEAGDPERDTLRAFEIPDRDPVAASAALEFDGHIVALEPEDSANGAIVVAKRKNTGWYEAYRISTSCGS